MVWPGGAGRDGILSPAPWKRRGKAKGGGERDGKGEGDTRSKKKKREKERRPRRTLLDESLACWPGARGGKSSEVNAGCTKWYSRSEHKAWDSGGEGGRGDRKRETTERKRRRRRREGIPRRREREKKKKL